MNALNVLQLMYERNLMVFQNLTTILTIYMALLIMSVEAERKVSNRSIIKKCSLNHNRGKTELSYILSKENITKPFVIRRGCQRVCSLKNIERTVLQSCAGQLINKNITLFSGIYDV